MKKAWEWLVYSSKDKRKLSLSIMAGVPAAVWIVGVSGQGNLDVNLANEFAEAVADFISKGVEWGLSGITLFAVGRKLYYSFVKKDEA